MALALCAGLLFASCGEKNIEPQEPVIVKLTVNGEIATKSGVSDNGSSVKHFWSKNDKIKAFIGAVGEDRVDVITLSNTSAEGSEKAAFVGTSSVKLERKAYQVYAVGPSASKVNENKLSDEVATIALSSAQVPSSIGSFDRGADVLVARPVELKVTDSLATAEISFVRPTALVKVALSDPEGKIAGDVVTSVKLSTANTPLAGYLSVNLVDLETSVASSESNEITVSYDEALGFAVDGKNAAWIVSAPAEVPAGEFTVTVVTDKNTITKTFSEAVTLSQVEVNTLEVKIDGSCQIAKKYVFSGGKGTEESPFQIASASDLKDLAAFSNGKDVPEAYATFDFSAAYYDVAADIVCEVADTIAAPFANPDKPFVAVFNGKNHTIKNLNISYEGEYDQPAGLIGAAGLGAVVKDLTLENVYVFSNKKNVGAFVGEASGATLSNLKVTGGVEGSYIYGKGDAEDASDGMKYGQWYVDSSTHAGVVGGILGYGKNVTIEGCSVAAKVKIWKRYGAGIVAFIDKGDKSIIRNCVLEKDAEINCDQTNIGGIVGANRDENLEVSGCKVYGYIYAVYSYVGGIIGSSYGAKIEDCEVSGTTLYMKQSDVTSASGNLGGMVGYHYAGPLTVKGCKVLNTYMRAGHSAAALVGISGHANGTNLSLEVSDCKVANDTLIGLRPYSSSNAYTYIGGVVGRAYSNLAYAKISNIDVDNFYLSGVSKGNGGLIGVNQVPGMEVRNCSLTNSELICTCTENAVITGGVVGYAQAGKFLADNCVVKNTSITGNAYLGFIAGQAAGTDFTITNCVVGSKCRIKGTYSLGGILGGCQAPAAGIKLLIDKCSAYCSIESTSNQVGGIVGLLGNSTATTGSVAVVSNCHFSKGDIVSSHKEPHLGGILGRGGNFSTNDSRITNYVVNCCARPNTVIGTNPESASVTNTFVAGAVGSAGYSTNLYGIYTDADPSKVYSAHEPLSAVFGVTYTLSKWYNSHNHLYYSNKFELPGMLALASDSALLENCEPVESFTDGALLTKMNGAASAYNASPLVPDTKAEAWVAGSDSYPQLSCVIDDPDK